VLPLLDVQLRTQSDVMGETATVLCAGNEVTRLRPNVANNSVMFEKSGYIVYLSSGTTGTPKLVRQERRRGRYRGVAVFDRYGAGPGRGPHIMGNPVFHLGTLGPALYALQAGSTVHILDRWSAEQFLETAADTGATSGFVSSGDLLDLVECDKPATPDLRALQHGGSRTPSWIKRAAIERFGGGLIEYYGTSHGPVSEITGSEWLRHPGSVGRPYSGIQVRIIGESEPGPLLITHRRGNAETSAEENPGDIGWIDDDDYLHVIGRSGTPDAVRLQHELSELLGVSNAIVDESGDAPVAVIELSSQAPRLRIEQMLAESPLDVECRFVERASLPRTLSRKVSRLPK
ncbi:AMP-binding protein, partial [Nocardia sp. NPDC060220]|uniref:AMP-binding protein n=1 Tax=Nocardia sp. NPDC060220 TaxID=3347076 RepID=UPI00366269BD